MKHEHHGKDFLFGAVLGSTLGALSALMFTTKKGHKIQHDLMDKYHEFEKVAKRYVHGKSRVAKKVARKAAKRAVSQLKKKVRKQLAKRPRRAKKKR